MIEAGSAQAAIEGLLEYLDQAEVAVTPVVAHQGGQDVYTYTVENVSFTTGVCRFVVSGKGNFGTLGMIAPAGWTGTVALDACGVATWWVWAAGEGSWLDVGGSATFSITLEGPTWESPGKGAVSALCPHGLKEITLPITPMACEAPNAAVIEATACLCSSSGGSPSCQAIAPFDATALGTRIHLIAGPAGQHIPSCGPSWIRHGFGDSAHDVTSPETCSDNGNGCALLLELFVDGAKVDPVTQTRPFPTGIPGSAENARDYFVQFPASYFEPGSTHTVTGIWTVSSCLDPALDYQFVRTVTLIADACQTPAALQLAPDLTTRIISSDCDVLTNARLYKLGISVRAEIENLGTAPASMFYVKLISPAGELERKVTTPIGPGEKISVLLEATSESWTCCCYPPSVPCPTKASVEVTADSRSQLEEVSETNNAAQATLRCS
jgi:hypothetical protein